MDRNTDAADGRTNGRNRETTETEVSGSRALEAAQHFLSSYAYESNRVERVRLEVTTVETDLAEAEAEAEEADAEEAADGGGDATIAPETAEYEADAADAEHELLTKAEVADRLGLPPDFIDSADLNDADRELVRRFADADADAEAEEGPRAVPHPMIPPTFDDTDDAEEVDDEPDGEAEAEDEAEDDDEPVGLDERVQHTLDKLDAVADSVDHLPGDPVDHTDHDRFYAGDKHVTLPGTKHHTALTALARWPGHTSNELADLTGESDGSISSAVTDLRAVGLVERDPDAFPYEHELTEAGERALEIYGIDNVSGVRRPRPTEGANSHRALDMIANADRPITSQAFVDAGIVDRQNQASALAADLRSRQLIRYKGTRPYKYELTEAGERVFDYLGPYDDGEDETPAAVAVEEEEEEVEVTDEEPTGLDALFDDDGSIAHDVGRGGMR